MRKSKVTVIVPTYNAEDYIGQCLDSVLRQSFRDFEVLVIDDGSKDGTGQVVKEYVKRDKRVRYVEQKKNVGVARTRNRAIKLAEGELIAFIDNDDFIDEDYLEKLLPRAGEEVTISGFKRPDNGGKIVKRMQLADTEWSKFMNPTPWAKIYRKGFILENGLEFLDNNIGEDIYFNLLAMLTAKKVRILDYVGYNWFLNRESVSSTKHKNFNDVNIFRLLDSCYDELEERGLVEKNYELLEFFFYRFIVWFLLYSSKGQSGGDIDEIYDRLFRWLEERFPDYRRNGMLKGRLPGEVGSTRAIYKTFLLAQKMGMGKTLVRLYAKI